MNTVTVSCPHCGQAIALRSDVDVDLMMTHALKAAALDEAGQPEDLSNAVAEPHDDVAVTLSTRDARNAGCCWCGGVLEDAGGGLLRCGSCGERMRLSAESTVALAADGPG